MSYSKKLQHPFWQRKRLEIFQRDNWTCQRCGDTQTTLHVHHEEYNGEPWDAPNNTLLTLCEKCHFKTECEKTIPEKDLMLQTRLELLDKINSKEYNPRLKHGWRLAVNLIEAEIKNNYGTL